MRAVSTGTNLSRACSIITVLADQVSDCLARRLEQEGFMRLLVEGQLSRRHERVELRGAARDAALH